MDRNSKIAEVEKLLEDENLITAEGFPKWFMETISHWKQTDLSLELNTTKIEREDHLSAWRVGNNNALKFIFFDVFYHQIFSAFVKALDSQRLNDCNTILEISEKCLVDFKELNKNSRYKNKEDEHLDGAEYILQSISTFCKLFCEPNNSEWKENMRKSTPFDELHPKAKAFGFAVKSRFFRIAGAKEDWLSAIDQCLEFDPDHWEWNIRKFKTLRQDRRLSFDRKLSAEPERVFAEKAFQQNPEHPLCIFKVSQCIAELLNTQSRSADFFPLDFGPKRFEDAEEIVQFLTEKATWFLTDFFEYSAWLRECSKFFQRDFPEKNRSLARTYLEQAFAVTPESSKINHRLGIFHKQDRNFNTAKEYIEKAYALCPKQTNNPVVHDLVQLYMVNPTTNRRRLTEIFQNFIPRPGDWATPKIIHKMGIFYFHVHEDASAVDAWVQLANNRLWHTYLKRTFKRLKGSDAGILGSWRESRNSNDRVKVVIERSRNRLDATVYNFLLSELNSVATASNDIKPNYFVTSAPRTNNNRIHDPMNDNWRQ